MTETHSRSSSTDSSTTDTNTSRIRKDWDRLVVVALCCLTVVVGALAGLESARLITARNNGETLNIIKDTVDPGGVRYQRNRKEQTAVLAILTDYTTAVVYCGKLGDTVATIKACADTEFAKLHPTEKGS